MGKIHKTVRFDEDVIVGVYKLASSKKEQRSFSNMLEILVIEALAARGKRKILEVLDEDINLNTRQK